MIKNFQNVYVQAQIRIDGNEFNECKFDRCTLEFSGTGPVSFVGCTFNGVNWVFSGPAQNTLAFLHGLYHGMGPGGRELVEATFENIRKPPQRPA
jgi:hypothetical protein